MIQAKTILSHYRINFQGVNTDLKQLKHRLLATVFTFTRCSSHYEANGTATPDVPIELFSLRFFYCS